ncbi:hypothetical protein ASE48_08500 [Mycobacterium sp. Root265]|uniref:hypothetical protein n=1 Tax=Mycobacterium sp. Root265 TaxID=1736504 RepID=UPI00070DED86|nr:hypothetical protein [Mycobacterium sp. Root265]KRD08594.1 hypothetical protein ASE48_08500 [Mycobacterium sp. Root265]
MPVKTARLLTNSATYATALKPGDHIIFEGVAQQVDSVTYAPVTSEVVFSTIARGSNGSTVKGTHRVSAHESFRKIEIADVVR